MIVLAVGPPLLAGAWMAGADVIDSLLKHEQEWEVVGGAGYVEGFEVQISCSFGTEPGSSQLPDCQVTEVDPFDAN